MDASITLQVFATSSLSNISIRLLVLKKATQIIFYAVYYIDPVITSHFKGGWINFKKTFIDGNS